MFNHIFALAPKLIEEEKKPVSLTQRTETSREKLVRQAQEMLPADEQDEFAQYAA
ncbi:hypothetical protein [Vibrio salinus]|uniref:hypothetical protein n=1 Tax=Vibrio salinus TaxID=2899784 RepID=UPI001E5FA1E6|nr:hypothetical protein [Vibrio salinus]MCE0495338.1 hypothetical protein [Vibrio salinus]